MNVIMKMNHFILPDETRLIYLLETKKWNHSYSSST